MEQSKAYSQFLVGHSHIGGLDVLEIAYLGLPLAALAVGLENMLEIVDGVLGEVCQVVLGLLDVHVDVGNLLFSLFDVELGDFAHRLFAQFQHMVAGYLLAEQRPVGVESALDARHLVLPRVEVATLQHLVYALLEEYLLQRHPVPAVFQLGQQYLQLLTKEVLGAEGGMPQDVARGHEDGLVVHNHARLRREGNLAVGERIQGVHHLVGRNAGGQVAHYLHLGGGVVVHLLYLDLLFFVGLQNTVYQHIGGHRIRYLGNDDGLPLLVVVHLGTDTQTTAQCAVVIFRHVDKAARGEVGVYLKRLVFQHTYRGFYQFAEVVRQYIRGECDGDALGALRQQQRELDRQRHRLLFAAVVTRLPLCGFGIEHHLLGELGEASLDITAGGGTVARQNVAPVTLAVHQQVLLPHLHQRVVDGTVTVGMVQHRRTHDVRHLGETPVVGLFHCVENTTLHRLQAVVDVRHRAVENDIGGIVNPIVVEHTVERQCRALTGRLVGLGGGGLHCLVSFNIL